MATHTTYEALHAALLEKIAAAVPALRTVKAYERLGETAPVPLAMVENTDIVHAEAQGDVGTDQFFATLSFSIYLIGMPTPEAASKLAIRALACELSAKLNRLHLGVPSQPVIVKGAYPDIVAAGGYNASGANSSRFVEVQRVDCEVSALFKPSVWNWPTEDVSLVWDDGIPVQKGDIL